MQSIAKRKILVTAGLPYANGQIHMGHLVEYLQTDMWVRYQKLRGHECHYFCGDDTHGTSIMIAAQKAGVTPEKYVADLRVGRLKDFADFQIEFTNFSSTHIPENKELCDMFYNKMKEKGHIASKDVKQAYCEHDKMFLPDRYVKGTCPKCGAKDQYGDSCDVCAATYGPNDLIDPHCSICGNKPVLKSSEHLVFKLNDFKSYLQKWVPEHNDKDISKKLMEWFNEDLRDWDISRDAPYFGFQIPGYTDKYFYVWVDAPIGYIAASQEWLKKQGRSYEEIWKDDKYEIYHFIGKDIVYFHSLFWPAMLKAADLRSPNKICVHGMLTINGEKMSKSKGTFINARTYLKHLDPTYLRYYYACKLSGAAEDLDLNLEDFVARVNSDLIGKITNLVSRGAQMLTKKMDGRLGTVDSEGQKLIDKAIAKSALIAELFEAREFSKVITEVRGLAEEGNRYFDEKEPWKLLKSDEQKTKAVLTATVNFFRILATYLKPFIPEYAKQVETLLKIELLWANIATNLENVKINDYSHIAVRVEDEKVKQMVEDSKETTQPKAQAAVATTSEFISIDDFMKIDLRVAKVVKAEAIPEADKLLKITVSVGSVEKTVFAGIKSKYKPEDLVGKHVVLVNNLQPRKMKFGLSEGMLLAASDESSGPFLLAVDEGAGAGFKIK
jgi:methionyl-tRNA synthetase